MTLDLAYGRRIYGWWARHTSIYRVATTITFLGRESKLRTKAVERLGLEPGETVLDLACGPGVNFPLLERVIGPTGRLIGFDYSDAMLGTASEAARRAGWANVDLVQGDAARMELPVASLDAALCTLGLSAMPDPDAALRNVHRALKPRGRLVVLDAALFQGPARVLNPLIKPIFVYTTNWNHGKDLRSAIRAVFGSASIEDGNGGSIFIASAEKQSESVA